MSDKEKYNLVKVQVVRRRASGYFGIYFPRKYTENLRDEMIVKIFEVEGGENRSGNMLLFQLIDPMTINNKG